MCGGCRAVASRTATVCLIGSSRALSGTPMLSYALRRNSSSSADGCFIWLIASLTEWIRPSPVENWQHSRSALSLWLSQREFTAALHTDAPALHSRKSKGVRVWITGAKGAKGTQQWLHSRSQLNLIVAAAAAAALQHTNFPFALFLLESEHVWVQKKKKRQGIPLRVIHFLTTMKWYICFTPHKRCRRCSLKLAYGNLFIHRLLCCVHQTENEGCFWLMTGKKNPLFIW